MPTGGTLLSRCCYAAHVLPQVSYPCFAGPDNLVMDLDSFKFFGGQPEPQMSIMDECRGAWGAGRYARTGDPPC